ncbi:MAG: energy transducer TonB [Xanthobacteraceae bacterium]
MTALALPWFEDEDPRDLRRWAIAAAIVFGVHAGAVGGYVFFHQPDEIGDANSPLAIDLAPSDDTIDQPEIAPVPEEQPKQVEEPPPPPEPSQAVVAPPDEPPPQPIEERKPPTPPVPARVKGGALRVEPSWQTALVRHLQQYKRYPSDAQSRGEEGVVQLSFTVDRTGHVLNREIARSSGHRELDNEVMSMIERAQPLPPFPASMPQAKLDLTVPIRFSLQ